MDFYEDGLFGNGSFEDWFEKEQQRKWDSGEYVNHCDGCAGEDCACCQYNQSNE